MIDFETGDAVARKLAQTFHEELSNAGHAEVTGEDVSRIFGLSIAHIVGGDWATACLMLTGMAKAAGTAAASQEVIQ